MRKRPAKGSKSGGKRERDAAWRKEGGGEGGKFGSKKGRVTRDAIY